MYVLLLLQCFDTVGQITRSASSF